MAAQIDENETAPRTAKPGALARAGVDIEVEVVIRGRARNGRRVRIGGEWIHTAPDGTFRVACVVVDGKLRVPVEAVEVDTCDVVACEYVTVACDA